MEDWRSTDKIEHVRQNNLNMEHGNEIYNLNC